MGYDYDEVSQMASAHEGMTTNIERLTRNSALDNELNERHDEAMKKVMYIESYIRSIMTRWHCRASQDLHGWRQQ